MNFIDINLQICCSNKKCLPNKLQFCTWLNTVVPYTVKKQEITIRLVDELESRVLNLRYRGENRVTNVLSFPFKLLFSNIEMETSLLGDIVICPKIVEDEAKKQKKTLMSHWAHIVIHGGLHLLGYNHTEAYEAKEMEKLEISALSSLGYKNPYIF